MKKWNFLKPSVQETDRGIKVTLRNIRYLRPYPIKMSMRARRAVREYLKYNEMWYGPKGWTSEPWIPEKKKKKDGWWWERWL